MKRYFSTGIWLVLVFVIVNASCSKEQVKSTGSSMVMPVQGILVFDDFDHMMETIQLVNEMDRSDLLMFEEQMAYTSFGRVADDIYLVIVPQDTFCYDSLLIYVQNNDAYIYLAEDENDWQSLEARFDICPQYYIMNLNRMYIVGDSVYKVFDEGLLITSTENYLEMIGIADEDLVLYLEYPEYFFIANFQSSKKKGTKDNAYNAGTNPKPASRKATTGNRRTTIRLKILPKGYNSYTQVFSRTVTCKARSYRRVLGVWFHSKSTLSVSFRFRLDYIGTDNDQKLVKIVLPPLIQDKKATAVYKFETKFQNDHFGGLDAWAKTPETDYARIQINPEICY